MDRRDVLRLLASAPVAASFAWTDAEAADAFQRATTARDTAGAAGAPFKPSFFNAHEFETVRVLADLVIPADERSGGATAAGVPEFMDFIIGDQPARQTAMRGGLAWLDRECLIRFDKTFVACVPGEQTAVLDDIAWPERARPEVAAGVAFFNSFRDLVAAGFWTSKMGIEDLQYKGNTYVRNWNGCPDEACKKLGVSYPAQ
jgi:gluconate 2-dehydrogenase gamma chain